MWNEFMRKFGWRDQASEILVRRKREAGMESRADIETMFQFIDADEGR
jgi:gluconokinase